jgi:phospholipid transport system transporter-binding protein
MIVRQGNRYLIEGPITHANVGTLIAESAAFEGDSVIVDLAGVTGADSSALSLLLEWVRRFGGSGRQIAFANVSANLRSLADLYGIADLIPAAAD